MLNWSEGFLPCGVLSILGPDHAAFPVCNNPLGSTEYVYFKQIAIALCLLSMISLEVPNRDWRNTILCVYIRKNSTARRSLGHFHIHCVLSINSLFSVPSKEKIDLHRMCGVCLL